MNTRPTPETDAAINPLININRLFKTSQKLERELDEAREELRKASVEANTLATSIQKAEYPDAKDFELLDSVAGVISQIDNMYAGVRQQRDEARQQRDRLAEALKEYREALSDGPENCSYKMYEAVDEFAEKALQSLTPN